MDSRRSRARLTESRRRSTVQSLTRTACWIAVTCHEVPSVWARPRGKPRGRIVLEERRQKPFLERLSGSRGAALRRNFSSSSRVRQIEHFRQPDMFNGNERGLQWSKKTAVRRDHPTDTSCALRQSLRIPGVRGRPCRIWCHLQPPWTRYCCVCSGARARLREVSAALLEGSRNAMPAFFMTTIGTLMIVNAATLIVHNEALSRSSGRI